ncbi:DUF192 domain-containing protein [Celeribacter marinus]
MMKTSTKSTSDFIRNWVIAGAALCVGGFYASHAQAQPCAFDQTVVSGDFGTVRFAVEVADDAGERAQGLMHREQMSRFSGMLFVYERPGRAAFWMKNTLIPLDMLFVDVRGVVTRIHENAVPLDLTAIEGGDAVFAVLEINGGLAAQLGLQAGDTLRHPAFGPDAAAPCDP